MVQASPQVTAAQFLDAGRRAEADGRVEYAIQFYRHLADHHGAAPEAVAARDALSRLRAQRTGEAQETSRQGRSPAPPPVRAPRRPPAGLHEAGSRSSPIRIAPVGAPESRATIALPEPTKGYLVGRLLAHGLAGLGVLLVVAAIVLAAGPALAPGLLRPWAGSALGHVLAASGALVGGMVLVLLSQVARALFDLAASSRDIAAIERVKADR